MPRRATKRPLNLIDFIAPLSHYASVLIAGELIAYLYKLIEQTSNHPTFNLYHPAAPSSLSISYAANTFALITISYGYLRVLLRNQRATSHRQLPPRAGRIGRSVARRFGRRAWFVWYLALPLWIALVAFGLPSLFFLANLQFIRTLISLPAPGTPYANIIDSAKHVARPAFALLKIIIFLFGLTYVTIGLISIQLNRPYLRKIIQGMLALLLSALLFLCHVVSNYTPDDSAEYAPVHLAR
jgi:hypothetical protein